MKKDIFNKVTISNSKNYSQQLQTQGSPSSQHLANGILD